MLLYPPPSSMETTGPNICSHLYDPPTCLAAQPLLCDPGNFSYVTTLPHLPQVAASLRGFKCGCSTMTTQTTAVWFPVRGLLLGSASSLNYHHLLLPFIVFLNSSSWKWTSFPSFFSFFKESYGAYTRSVLHVRYIEIKLEMKGKKTTKCDF